MQRQQQPQLLWLADYSQGNHKLAKLNLGIKYCASKSHPPHPPFAFTGTKWEDEEEARNTGSVPANSHVC